MAINIIIGGDFCPNGRNQSIGAQGSAAGLFHDLAGEFQGSDLSIINLECPLISRPSPIRKIGPVLGVPEDCVNGLTAAGIGLIGLANNHILDHGEAGLKNTLGVCRGNSIPTVGAGENLAEAGQVITRDLKELKVAVIALAEHEFSIATETSGGANPIDLIRFARAMRELRQKSDFTIVLLHGGVEGYPFPSPRLREICRFMAEEGAGAVICQHTHCPGCYETYRDSHLVYGQGNLLFDLPGRPPSWHEGFLVKLEVKKNQPARMEIIPYFQSKGEPGTRRMKEEEEQDFRSRLEERSRQLGENGFVKQQWLDYCRKTGKQYLNGAMGYGPLLGRLNNKLHFPSFLRPRESYLRQLNHIRCESHREALLTILDEKTRKN